MKAWDKFKFKYLTFVAIGLGVAAFLGGNESFKNWIHQLGAMEYLGAFIAGSLFVSSFTVGISTVVIAVLASDIHPLPLGLIGGAGALFGDLLILRLVRDHVSDELILLFGKNGHAIKILLRSKYIAWMLPIIGAFIIASPLPDEFGVSLLGLSKMSETNFIIISYISNALGILMIASVARVF